MKKPDTTAPTKARESVASTPGGRSPGASPVLPFRPRLTKPHPLIQSTKGQSTAHDVYDRSARNAPKCIDIDVSKAMNRTALVVMDRFIKALEAADIKVDVIEDQRGRGTFALKGHDRVQLRIEEKCKRIPHVSTAKELREKEQFPWTRIPKWDDVPTGELVLSPGGVVDVSSESAIDQLVKKAVSDVADNLEGVRRHREAAEAARRKEWEQKRRIEEEKDRVKALHEAADALRRYRILMDYIEEVRRFGRVPNDQRREGQTMDEWLSWAEAQAQRIHPLGR